MLKRLSFAPLEDNLWLSYNCDVVQSTKEIVKVTGWIDLDSDNCDGRCVMCPIGGKINIFIWINPNKSKNEIIHTVYHEVIHVLAMTENQCRDPCFFYVVV